MSCDRVLVVQALRNLLENGLRHGGGRVFVRTRRAGERACVRIEDRGSGIPPDLLPLLFHRFARADLARSDGGLGLGLSLARAIIEAHGGTLELVPSKSGAAFELELPIEPASPT